MVPKDLEIGCRAAVPDDTNLEVGPEVEGSLAMEPTIDVIAKDTEPPEAEAFLETTLDEEMDEVAPLPRLARAFRLLEHDLHVATTYKLPEDVVDAIRTGLTKSNNIFEAFDIRSV